MKYEGMYNKLIADHNSFISESMKTKSRLESELRLLEAELNLYTECYSNRNMQKYADLQFDANKNYNDKQDEIITLDQKVSDAQNEIKVLQDMIELEEYNENATKINSTKSILRVLFLL